MISGTRKPDGSLVITSWRLLWKSEAIQFTTNDDGARVCDPQQLSPCNPQTENCGSQSRAPFSVTLAIGKSRSDEESIALATAAAVQAAMKGVVP